MKMIVKLQELNNYYLYPNKVYHEIWFSENFWNKWICLMMSESVSEQKTIPINCLQQPEAFPLFLYS